jgi:hypothetical protein
MPDGDGNEAGFFYVSGYATNMIRRKKLIQLEAG